ncbi:MAG: class I SAM-dependent methyltransferase [Planctomycetota bacterium]|jgi:tRNA (cmo5U34)-methyltransferase
MLKRFWWTYQRRLLANAKAGWRIRLENNDRIEYCQADINELDFPADSFDLIVSSITIHHLNHHEKELLFRKALNWLTNEAVFT